MIESAFWDASAIIPLCAETQASRIADKLFQQYEMFIWWGTPVEVRSALARLLRMGQLTTARLSKSLDCVDDLNRHWQEIEPSISLRAFAEELPQRYGLRAADALQLAAAWTWTMHRPANRRFVSGDQKLLDAARKMGFHAIAV